LICYRIANFVITNAELIVLNYACFFFAAAMALVKSKQFCSAKENKDKVNKTCQA